MISFTKVTIKITLTLTQLLTVYVNYIFINLKFPTGLLLRLLYITLPYTNSPFPPVKRTWK